ncbi:hypothetical protein D9757_004928 [Collybiopsis confluens]|uniref:Ubiquitin-like protease family profile domain-containing protein n=1 Tax=Collybiopsis confluens TaxID=2823264 RepID=A0A8H5HTW6_9AGAR|nr:hypothetical protein D9757_004928 [Collybiopsis confluens]
MVIKSEAPPDVTHRIQKSSNIKPSDATLRVKKLLKPLKPDTQSTSKFAGLQIPKNSSSSFTQQAETRYASSSKIIMKKLNNVKNSSLSNENVKFLKTFSEPAHDGFIIPEPTDPGPPVTKKNCLFGFPIEFSNKRLKSIIRQITDADIKRLDPDRYLNNTLIEYGLLLWQWGLEMTYPAKMDTIYVFNSFFFRQLEIFGYIGSPDESYDHVKTWTSNNKFEIDLFSRDFIIIPINETHSSTFADGHDGSETRPIELNDEDTPLNERAMIYILDSMVFTHEHVGARLINYLRCEARDKKGCSNTLDPVVPRQPNGKDCGIYLIHCAECFVETSTTKSASKRQLKHAKKPSSKRRRIEEPKNAPSKGIRKSKPEYEQEEEENDNDEDEEVSGSDESDFDTTTPKFAKYRKIIEFARFVPMLLHPQPSFYEIFQIGLEDAGTLEDNICDRFETLLVEAINKSRLKRLIRKMYIQVSDGITQDVRSLKERILDYVEDTLDEEMYPRIKRGAKKSHMRGFWHPQLARLLVPATMLEKFQADPDLFCQQYRDRRLEGGPILSTHIPSFFYADLGDLVSCDFRKIFSGLLEGQLIVQTLVHLYLGEENATEFREYYRNLRNTDDDKKFTVKKAGKAYQRKITSISFPMIAYTTMIARRMDASRGDKPPLQNDEDPHCGLSLMSKVLDLEAEEQKAADEAEAKAKTEAAKEGKKREQQKEEDLPSDTNAEIVPSSRSNTPPPPSSDWDARPSSRLSIELGAEVANDDVVAESEDETYPVHTSSNTSSSASRPSTGASGSSKASKPSSSSSQQSSSALKKTKKSKPKAKTTTLTSSSSEPDCSDTRSKDMTKIKKLQPLPRKKAWLVSKWTAMRTPDHPVPHTNKPL